MRLKKHPTPYYLYDLKAIKKRCQDFRRAIKLRSCSYHYAVKANVHPKVLETIKLAGYGVDVVSIGEMRRALAVGFHAKQIIFSGVGKTVEEITFALKKNIKQINVESFSELQRIALIAKKLRRRATVGIRINPNINPKTHPYITTGFSTNKFGIDLHSLPEIEEFLKSTLDIINFAGFSMHVGSQIKDLKAFKDSIAKGLELTRKWKARGWNIHRLDIGGGLAIDYTKDARSDLKLIGSYGKLVSRMLKDSDLEILFEPGRILVARAGYLVTQVQYIKHSRSRIFAVVDTGMHHLIRPALYGAFHRVLQIQNRKKKFTYQIVGPICESSDFLAQDRRMSEIQQGDTLVIADVGAYGYSMASTYNLHELPDELIL